MKQVGLTPDACALLEALQRDGETFSDVVVRIVTEWEVLQRVVGNLPETAAAAGPVEEPADVDHLLG